MLINPNRQGNFMHHQSQKSSLRKCGASFMRSNALLLAGLLLSSVLSIASPAKARNGQAVLVLEPGKPIKREIGGEQSHSYKTTLEAGQYLRVRSMKLWQILSSSKYSSKV